MKSLFSFRVQVLIAIFATPFLPIAVFFLFGYPFFYEQVELDRTKGEVELAETRAQGFRSAVEHFESLGFAVYREVVERDFNGASAVFNSNPDLVYFRVMGAERSKTPLELRQPAYQLPNKQLLLSFLDSRMTLLSQDQSHYLAVRGQGDTPQQKYILIARLRASAVPPSKNGERSHFLVQKGRVMSLGEPAAPLIDLSIEYLSDHEYSQQSSGSFVSNGHLHTFQRIFDREDIFFLSVRPWEGAFQTNPSYWLNFLTLAAALLSFVLLISIFISRRLSSGVQELALGVERVSDGNFEHPIPVRGRDEIAILASKFNTMVERIRTLFIETERKAILEKDLETAKVIQSTVIPQSELRLPDYRISSFYRALESVGGDLWSYSTNDRGELSVFVSDATGHGAAAAMATTACAATLECVRAMRFGDIQKIFETINEVIFKMFLGKMYMTAAMSVFTGPRFRCTSAAHESFILLRQNGEVIHLEPEEPSQHLGRSLGLPKLEILEGLMEPGDKLICYSDGIFELKSEKGNLIGLKAVERHLRKIKGLDLSSHQVRNHLLKLLLPSIQMGDQVDDVVLVVTEYRPGMNTVDLASLTMEE